MLRYSQNIQEQRSYRQTDQKSEFLLPLNLKPPLTSNGYEPNDNEERWDISVWFERFDFCLRYRGLLPRIRLLGMDAFPVGLKHPIRDQLLVLNQQRQILPMGIVVSEAI